MPEPSLTIGDFCALEKISRVFFYKLDKQGKAPLTYYVGAARRITPEAHQEWRLAREAETPNPRRRRVIHEKEVA